MPKLRSTSYKVSAGRDGRALVEFRDQSGRVFAIEMPTIALMGLAHGIRQAAQSATVPLTERATTSQMRIAGPPVPPLERSGDIGPSSLAFSTGVTADFEKVSLSFQVPKEAGGGELFDALLPPEDAANLIQDLQKALGVARTKPTSGTAH